MFYIQIGCPICRTGAVGVRRCADGKTLVLMCDECETVWSSPEHIDVSTALEADVSTFVVELLGVAIAGKAAGWATEEEVTAKGWWSLVKGTQSV